MSRAAPLSVAISQEVGAGVGQGVGDGDQRPAGGDRQASPEERDDALGFAQEHDAEEAAQDIVEHEHQGIWALVGGQDGEQQRGDQGRVGAEEGGDGQAVGCQRENVGQGEQVAGEQAGARQEDEEQAGDHRQAAQVDQQAGCCGAGITPGRPFPGRPGRRR